MSNDKAASDVIAEFSALVKSCDYDAPGVYDEKLNRLQYFWSIQKARDLLAEIVRLRAALEPFARTPYATVDLNPLGNSDPEENYICEGVSIGDLHRAHAALNPPTGAVK